MRIKRNALLTVGCPIWTSVGTVSVALSGGKCASVCNGTLKWDDGKSEKRCRMRRTARDVWGDARCVRLWEIRDPVRNMRDSEKHAGRCEMCEAMGNTRSCGASQIARTDGECASARVVEL